MERILYIWAIRHPASGYVQGINDLLTPLYVVFLSAHVGELPMPVLAKCLPFSATCPPVCIQTPTEKSGCCWITRSRSQLLSTVLIRPPYVARR